MIINLSNFGGGGGSGSGYTLPIASSSVLGGVKIGEGIAINSAGTISVSGGSGSGIEGVTSLPASGTDGQLVVLDEFSPTITITGRSGDNNPISCTATGITQKTKLFSWEYYGDTWPVYVNSDNSIEIYNNQTSETTTYNVGTSGAVYDFTNDRYITINVTSNGFLMTPNSNVGRFEFTNDSIREEKQTLFVYGTDTKPAIEYHLSNDRKMFNMNWSDIQNVMADGDVLFYVTNLDNMDIRYSGGTLYSVNRSDWGVKTPSSTVREFLGLYIVWDNDNLQFWFDETKSVSGGTLFSGKAQMSGWTRYGVVQEDACEGAASDVRFGMVRVSGNGLYMDNGFLKCNVSVDTATTGSTGVVKPSSGLSITNDGTLTTQVQASNVGNNVVKIWIGTQAEYEEALANGEIKVGTLVNITDDYDEEVYIPIESSDIQSLFA